MPNNWSIVDATFPTFKGDESPKEQVAALVNYMKTLTEQLKYSLDNLGVNNWNATELKNLSDDVASLLAEDIEKMGLLYDDLSAKFIRLESSVADLAEKFAATGNFEDQLQQISNELQTINGNLDIMRQDITALQGGAV